MPINRIHNRDGKGRCIARDLREAKVFRRRPDSNSAEVKALIAAKMPRLHRNPAVDRKTQTGEVDLEVEGPAVGAGVLHSQRYRLLRKVDPSREV